MSLSMTYHLVYINSNMTGATGGAGTQLDIFIPCMELTLLQGSVLQVTLSDRNGSHTVSPTFPLLDAFHICILVVTSYTTS